MQKPVPRRAAATGVAVFLFVLLVVATDYLMPVPAHASRLAAADVERRERQSLLRADLTSAEPGAFRRALGNLKTLDEPGALALWQQAIAHADPQLKKEAWAEYRQARARLERKEFVPQIVRVQTSPEDVKRLADAAGLEVTIWSEAGSETVAAAPPYLVERLRRAGLTAEVLYDSVSAWQRARIEGDQQAVAITPPYQKDAESKSQVRVAVIERARRGQPAAGYSDWLGDHEDILMSNDSFIAYLDIFASDGSPASVSAHVEERYTRRGYRLAGFYTPEEFAENVNQFFPGKKFAAGANAQAAGEIRPALSEGKFHNYEETLAEFTALAAANPHLARVVELGATYENRKIFALKIAKNPEIDDSSKPDVLITGAYHAREWISVEPPIYFANQLISGYATDDLLRHLVDRLQIWIVPIVNPDGLTYSQGAPNNHSDTVRLWRKNRHPIAVEGCGSSVGVDLNRNYDYEWRLRGDEPCPNYRDDSGGSDDPANEIYRGPRPDSELEVKAIKALTSDPNRRFRAQIDFHSFSQLILYPWGHASSPAPDADMIGSLAQQMSDAMFGVHRVRYEPRQAFNLYNTTGSSIDYAYGANGTPAPFLIELRPTCCGFNTPEKEIEPINQETWAGLRPILDWVAGPPILEAVQAYQAGPDGGFTKLVYAARWANSDVASDARRLVVETRFPRLEPGRIQVRLQFSAPMSIAAHPQVTLGRDGILDEVAFAAEDGTQGWQKTVYQNDTWVGEAVIPQDANQISPWQLGVAALDTRNLQLDARPATVAAYVTGATGWQGYEDKDGGGVAGGTDAIHMLSPTISGDFFSLFVAEPNGGERLAGGEPYTVIWSIQEHPSFIPVQHTIALSTDGGGNFSALADLPGEVEKYAITLPRIPTTRARIRVSSREGVFGNSIYGDSQTDFSICDNVGSAVAIGFVSSERMDLNWSDAPFDNPGGMVSGAARFLVTINLTNTGNVWIASPFVRVADITGGNVLLSRDLKSNQTIGARQSIDAGGDNLIAPGETVQARLMVGLVEAKKKFTLAVQLYGVPVGGSISPSNSVVVWKKKPKNKGL